MLEAKLKRKIPIINAITFYRSLFETLESRNKKRPRWGPLEGTNTLDFRRYHEYHYSRRQYLGYLGTTEEVHRMALLLY